MQRKIRRVLALLLLLSLAFVPAGPVLADDYAPGDANGDNACDVLDLDLLIQAFDTVPTDPNWNPFCDWNTDASVDVLDLDILIQNFDVSFPPNPTSFWRMEETDNNPRLDSVGSNHLSIWSGGGNEDDDTGGRVGNCIKFGLNASSGGLYRSNSTALSPGTGDWEMTLWFWPESAAVSG